MALLSEEASSAQRSASAASSTAAAAAAEILGSGGGSTKARQQVSYRLPGSLRLPGACGRAREIGVVTAHKIAWRQREILLLSLPWRSRVSKGSYIGLLQFFFAVLCCAVLCCAVLCCVGIFLVCAVSSVSTQRTPPGITTRTRYRLSRWHSSSRDRRTVARIARDRRGLRLRLETRTRWGASCRPECRRALDGGGGGGGGGGEACFWWFLGLCVVVLLLCGWFIGVCFCWVACPAHDGRRWGCVRLFKRTSLYWRINFGVATADGRRWGKEVLLLVLVYHQTLETKGSTHCCFRQIVSN